MENKTSDFKFKNLDVLAIMLRARRYTKRELMAYFGVSERTIRAMIHAIKDENPILAPSRGGGGYKIATTPEELAEVEHQIREDESRAKQILIGIPALSRFKESVVNG